MGVMNQSQQPETPGADRSAAGFFKDGQAIVLPPELRAQLGAFERRLRRLETLAACCGALGGLLLSYLLVFALDRCFDTPAMLRVLLMLVGAAALGGAGVWWLRHWLWRRRSGRELARLVQRQFPRLGDRLLGVVELAEEGPAATQRASPALLRAALAQVAAESRRYDFAQAAPVRRPRRLALGFGLLLLLAAGAVVLAPPAARNALLRWLKPLATVERFTFVSLEALPDELVTPHGEPFEIACGLTGLSRWRPPAIRARIGEQPVVRATFRGGRAILSFPGQTAPAVLALRAGDFSKRIQLRPLFRPELLRLQAHIVWPGYLQRPPSTEPVSNGRLALLYGAQVSFEGQANRALDNASLSNGTAAALAVTNAGFRSAALTMPAPAPDAAPAPPRTLTFVWTDTHRLRCAAPYRLELSGRPDEPPTLQCEGLADAVAVLPDEVVELRVAAKDDYGVQRVWLDWWLEREAPAAPPPASNVTTRLLAAGAPDCPATNGACRIAPLVWGVPEGVTIALCAKALDYLPERTPSTSTVFRVHVLSRADHAKLLQEQARNLLARLDDLAREEERLLTANTELAAQSPDSLKSEKAAGELRANEQGERANARQLEQLARDLEKLTQDGLRNTEVSAATLRDWQKNSSQMQQIAAQPMAQAAQAMAGAQADAGQRQPQTERAAQQEAQALAQMRDLQRSAQAALDQMSARNFVNRLRDAAKKEDEIAAAMQRDLPVAAGLPAEQLPAPARERLTATGREQERNRRAAQDVRDDLAGFYNLTRKEVYEEVRQEMSVPDVAGEMRALGETIARNMGGKAIGDAQALKGKLNAWADKLEPAAGDSGGSGSGGDQQQIEADVLLGLMRARVRQEGLREQTRAAGEVKAGALSQAALSAALGKLQASVTADTRALAEKTKIPQVAQGVQQVAGVMEAVEGRFREGATDSGNIALQTVVIETIAGMVQPSSGSRSGTEPSEQELAAMMAAARKPGGNTAHGTTDRPNERSGGAAAGAAAGSRRVRQSGGDEGGALPAEYRDVLQDFFRAAETEAALRGPGAQP